MGWEAAYRLSAMAAGHKQRRRRWPPPTFPQALAGRVAVADGAPRLPLLRQLQDVQLQRLGAAAGAVRLHGGPACASPRRAAAAPPLPSAPPPAPGAGRGRLLPPRREACRRQSAIGRAGAKGGRHVGGAGRGDAGQRPIVRDSPARRRCRVWRLTCLLQQLCSAAEDGQTARQGRGWGFGGAGLCRSRLQPAGAGWMRCRSLLGCSSAAGARLHAEFCARRHGGEARRSR